MHTMSYTTGNDTSQQPNLRATITSEKEVSVDYIVDEATEIWKKTCARKLPPNDTEVAEKWMQEMRKIHREFCTSYPLVLRYMCQMQEYDAKAFRRWLTKLSGKVIKTEDEYLEVQADYVATLFKYRNPRASSREIGAVRHNILTILREEHKIFKQYADEFNRRVSAEEEVRQQKNIQELREFASVAGRAGVSNAESIICESDISSADHVDLDRITATEPLSFIGPRAESLLY